MNSQILTSDLNAKREGTPCLRPVAVIINLVETRQMLRSTEIHFRTPTTSFPVHRLNPKIERQRRQTL